MILVGLTGGIGSGKSTVSSMLRNLGAVVIDADAIVHELQQPGQPLLAELADAFGAEILDAEGRLDRASLASRAFADATTLERLNKIVHPAVGKEMATRLEAQRETDSVVVLDIPLLVENPREGLCGTLVVDIPTDLAVERLVEFRSMKRDDAEARIAKQASREARRAIADRVIDNSGDLASLELQVADAWEWMTSLPAAAPDAGKPTRPSGSK
jgi:dephospho-CoA kinase